MKHDRNVRGPAVALAITLVVLSGAVGAVRPEGDAARLARRAGGPSPLAADLAELCDRIGGRPTMSPYCRRAVDWAAAKLTAAGVDSVALEPFPMPVNWLPDEASAWCTMPEEFELRIAACPLTPSTPGDGAIEAPLVHVGGGSPDAIAKAGSALEGAIALVTQEEMTSLERLFGEYLVTRARDEALAAAGARAILIQSSRPRGLLYRHSASFNRTMARLPAAIVGREQAARLARLAAAGPARVRLRIVNQIGPPAESRNVVGEIRGSERPEEIVLIGAHLDGWDLGTAANDNGVNCALVIDLARAIRETGLRPRRTIRFVLFTGEEEGMIGSAGYVARHAAELDDHVAVIIFDIGSGRTTGFFLNGRPELGAAIDEALADAGLSKLANLPDAVDGTDNFDFMLAGVPNLVAFQDPAPYLPDYHAESDTLDKVDLDAARANEAIAAAVVWGFATRAERPARRQTSAEVDRLLEATGIAEQMKAFGQPRR